MKRYTKYRHSSTGTCNTNVFLYITDQYFYAIGGYSRCCVSTGTVQCTPCPTDIGYSDKIWKFEPVDPQPSTGDYPGQFVELSGETSCQECSLKYGLTDVVAIVLPQYIKNTFYTDHKGKSTRVYLTSLGSISKNKC